MIKSKKLTELFTIKLHTIDFTYTNNTVGGTQTMTIFKPFNRYSPIHPDSSLNVANFQIIIRHYLD